MRILACSLVVVALGCTRSNAAFDELDGTGTAGEDGATTKETTPLDDGTDTAETRTADSLETGSTHASDDDADETDDTSGDTGSDSTGIAGDCNFPPFDAFEVEFIDVESQQPFVGNCRNPIDLRGQLVASQDASNEFQIRVCGDSCDCGEEFELVDVHMPLDPDLVLPECVHVIAEYLAGETCEFSGVVVSNGSFDGLPLLVAGRRLKTLPMAVGGQALEMVEPDLCECETCKEGTGTYALGFPSGDVVPEGETIEYELFEREEFTYSIRNIASRVDEAGEVVISWVAHR